VREDGMPITEYLPEGHEGREIYGVITDPPQTKAAPTPIQPKIQQQMTSPQST